MSTPQLLSSPLASPSRCPPITTNTRQRPPRKCCMYRTSAPPPARHLPLDLTLTPDNVFRLQIFRRRQSSDVENTIHTVDANATQQNSSVGSGRVGRCELGMTLNRSNHIHNHENLTVPKEMSRAPGGGQMSEHLKRSIRSNIIHVLICSTYS